MDKLRKSVRVDRHMLANMPINQRHPSYQHALAYLRSLYTEFGRSTVRAALKELSDA